MGKIGAFTIRKGCTLKEAANEMRMAAEKYGNDCIITDCTIKPYGMVCESCNMEKTCMFKFVIPDKE